MLSGTSWKSEGPAVEALCTGLPIGMNVKHGTDACIVFEVPCSIHSWFIDLWQ